MAGVAVVPHLYDVKWSRDLNRILTGEFGTVTPYRHDSYLPARSLQHRWLANALPIMRRDGYRVALFANLLEDWTPDIVKATGVGSVVGIVHGSNFQRSEPGATARLRTYERAVAEGATVLVATQWLADQLPYPTTVVGLPVVTERTTPRTGTDILWNHRLSSEKGVRELVALPKPIRDRIVVTAPKFAAVSVPKVRAAIPRVYLGLPDAAYMGVVDGCGYGLSTSHYDNFGYSVADATMRGLCVFVPDTDETAYRETMPPELRYRSVIELADRIDHYDRHPDERAAIVTRAQDGFARFAPDRWLEAVRVVVTT